MGYMSDIAMRRKSEIVHYHEYVGPHRALKVKIYLYFLF